MKEDVKDASGGERECWFGEEGCHELSEMESGSQRDCCQSVVNPAIPVYEDKHRSIKIGLMIDDAEPNYPQLIR